MNSLLLLTSPPASGKTFWIRSFFLTHPGTILIISPLRALADECKEKWGDEIQVMTPEEWLLKPRSAEIVIFDEFHLNFYWGDSFRPLLWEVFWELSCSSNLVILLTATLGAEMKEEISHFNSHFDEIIWSDHGNQNLKYKPFLYIKAPSKRWMGELIELGPRGEGVSLIFCPYRQEVTDWATRLKGLGYTVWTCVGGEAGAIKELIKKGGKPDFIIATTVLSHGVNLPAISCVFLLYPLENVDFWIQMVARGGRKGEAYEVIALEEPHGIKWSKWTNFLAILRLNLKMKWHHFITQGTQCFLKELS